MSHSFVYTSFPSRVLFGSGTVDQVGAEADRLGMRRALVLCTAQQQEMAETLAGRLGERAAGLFPGAAMHTPVTVTETAMEEIRRHGADGLVSIGGGSTTGLGKAISYRTGLPHLVLPTTYAGSEMTDILGQTENGQKTTLRHPGVRPSTVVYDVDLTLSLPPRMAGLSGMNAMAHAVEALYSPEANPVLSLMAAEGIGALYRALPVIADAPENREARSEALYGAWLCAVCLGSTGMALHHKLCHVLGGSFDLPHAETHTAVLPHALSFNAPAVPGALEAMRRAMDTDAPAAALFDLGRRVGAQMGLRELGMPEEGIDRAVEISLKNPYWNPRELERQGLRELLKAAWAGERPVEP